MEEKSIEAGNNYYKYSHYVHFELIGISEILWQETFGRPERQERPSRRKTKHLNLPNINASKYDGFSHKLERVLFYAST